MKIVDIIRYQADSHNDGGIANGLRKSRMKIFENFFGNLYNYRIEKGETIHILDVGGSYNFWKAMDFCYISNVEITLLNIIEESRPPKNSGFTSVIADATNMIDIKDKEYDFVFSNSCIEHVGDMQCMRKMAEEIKRVGCHYFLQTPNRYFPIEPHFLFPLFQFFPIKFRALFIRCFQLGFWPKGRNWEESLKIANEIKLLSYKDLRSLFPEAKIDKEIFLGFTKSFMVYK